MLNGPTCVYAEQTEICKLADMFLQFYHLLFGCVGMPVIGVAAGISCHLTFTDLTSFGS